MERESEIDWDSQALGPDARRAPYWCNGCGAFFRKFRLVDERRLTRMRERLRP
jgi:hypothetical protein